MYIVHVAVDSSFFSSMYMYTCTSSSLPSSLLPSLSPSLPLYLPPPSTPIARRPVPVTSDMELSVMKNKIAELKAQLNKDPSARDRATSQPERDGSFVSPP